MSGCEKVISPAHPGHTIHSLPHRAQGQVRGRGEIQREFIHHTVLGHGIKFKWQHRNSLVCLARLLLELHNSLLFFTSDTAPHCVCVHTHTQCITFKDQQQSVSQVEEHSIECV